MENGSNQQYHTEVIEINQDELDLTYTTGISTRGVSVEVTSAEEVHDESFFDALDTLNTEDENKDTSVIKVETVDTNRVAKSNFYASFQCKNLIEKRICDHRKLKSCYSLLDEIMNSILITHDCSEQVSKFLELNSSATQECKDLALSVINAFQNKLA